MEQTVEELKEKLKDLHHASKEAKEIKEKLAALEGGKKDTSPKKTKVLERDYSPEGFKIDVDKTYEFRLVKPKRGRKQVPRTAFSWDEKLNRTREIRYTRTEVSPYRDEQDEYALDATIAPSFRDGVLKVKGSNEPLIRYLLAYDGFNKKKTVCDRNRSLTNMYYLHETDLVEASKRERRELELQAENIVKEASEDQLKHFLESRFNKKLKGDELVRVAYDLAREYPLDFVKDLNNPIHAIKSEISALFYKGLVSESNGVISWASSGSNIYSYNPATKRDKVDVLARWVLAGSEEAKKFKEVAYSKLEE